MRNSHIFIVFATLTLLTSSNTQQPSTPASPMWQPTWMSVFSEAYTVKDKVYVYNGKFFYDYPNKRQRSDKWDSKDEPICNSILPNVTSNCTHLVVNEKRYIFFPTKNVCCVCCDASHGCGVIKPDWFFNGIYQGLKRVNGQMADKWIKPDVLDAFYWISSDEFQIPMKYVQNNHTHSISWDQNSYSNFSLPDSVFVLPSYCNPEALCPSKSLCGKMRQQKNQLQAQ